MGAPFVADGRAIGLRLRLPGSIALFLVLRDMAHRSRQPHPGQDDRRKGTGGQSRLLVAAYAALRPRRHLPVLLGGANGVDGPGGIALLDHSTFDVLGPWESDRGPQYLAYDAWWYLKHNTAVTSEWGTPSMRGRPDPELLLGGKYGHALHF